MTTKRPPITARTNIGWSYGYLPGECPDTVDRPDVIATPGTLDSKVSSCKLKDGLGRYGVGYVSEVYRKLDGQWVRLTQRECERLSHMQNGSINL